jgi:microcystin-dependent protein
MTRMIAIVLSGLLFIASESVAQPCPTGSLTTLTNGTNADATQVMNNFIYVANCVNNFSAVPPGTVVAYSGVALPSGWLWANGALVSRTTYSALLAALSATSTVTITIASPGVVTWTSHGLSNDWPVQFSTTGALPTGLTTGQTYYVISATTNTFQVALAPGGTAIGTSGSQSGTQTGILAPYGNGDGSTNFQLPDLRGRTPFGLDNLGGPTGVGRVTSAVSGINGTSPAAAGGDQRMQSHTHGINDPGHVHSYGAGQIPSAFTPRGTNGDGTNFNNNPSTNSAATGISIQSTGAGGSQNMPPALMTNYIVKY